MANKKFITKNGLQTNNIDFVDNINNPILSNTVNLDSSGNLNISGNVILGGTIDGRNLETDGLKLDGIEAGATGDLTASEILTLLKTVDGASSGLDADLLDGQNSSYYAPISGPTFTGTVVLPSTTSIGTISSTELSYVDGVTSSIQTQLNNKAPIVDGLIPSNYLPSYVDDVIEVANYAALPVTGETGKIYVTLDTNKQYRWSGSAYVYITSGAVDSVAGKTGVVTLVKADVGLDLVDNTADSTKNVLSATKLTTARTIGGVSFNGTANINLPGVNIAGTQSTTGNAATATKLATPRSISGASFDGSADVVIPNVTTSANGLMSSTDKTKLDGIESGATADMTTAEILTAIKTVDGAGSGLDADLLDGVQGSDYAKLSSANVFTNNAQTIQGTAPGLILQETDQVSPNDLARIILSTGKFYVQCPTGAAIKFSGYNNTECTGLEVFYSGLYRTIWHAGNDGAGSGLDADLLDGMQSSATPAASSVVASNASGEIDPAWQGAKVARLNRRIALGITPTLDFDFVNQVFRLYQDDKGLSVPKALADVVTFTRATTGTYFDSKGVLKTAAINVPRIDHDPFTGECLGFLSEPDRTNIVTNSENFGDASWAKLRSTITNNAVVAPDGTTTADKLVCDSTANISHYFNSPYYTYTGQVVCSVHVKPAEFNHVVIQIIKNGGAGYASPSDLVVNLIDGTYTGGVGGDPTVDRLKDGWVRISIKSNDDTATSVAMRALLYNGTSIIFNGDGTSGIYVWGAQIEVGDYLSSYIPTTTAAVLRSKDQMSMSSIGTFFNSFDFSAILEYDTNYTNSPSVPRIWQVDDGTVTNRLTLYQHSTGRSTLYNSTSPAGSAGGSTFTATKRKVTRLTTISVNPDMMMLCDNGTEVMTRSPNALNPTGYSTMRIGCWNHTEPSTLGGHVKKLIIYPRSLTSAQLQELSK